VPAILFNFFSSAALYKSNGSGADSLKLRFTFCSVVLSSIRAVKITITASGVSPILTESGLEKLHWMFKEFEKFFTRVQLNMIGGSEDL
jgi:hypothetical protein